ncbi:MAG: hypothetical protein ACRDYC_02200 [Acidimicrobiales bacterium]
MPTNKWVDRTQPQTLYMGVLLLYMNAIFEVLDIALGLTPILLVPAVLQVLAGWGIANEKKWGYWLGVGASILVLVLLVFYFAVGLLIAMIFDVALVALLLHPQSREYRRIWFR